MPPEVEETERFATMWSREPIFGLIGRDPDPVVDWSGIQLPRVFVRPAAHRMAEPGGDYPRLFADAIRRAVIAAIQPESDPLQQLRAEVADLRVEIRALRDELTSSPNPHVDPSKRMLPPQIKLSAPAQIAELTDLEDDGIELVRPISVTVEVLGDRIVVSDEDVNMYGTGETLDAALRDYRASVVEYYIWLVGHEVTLASHLRAHLAWLRDRLRPRKQD